MTEKKNQTKRQTKAGMLDNSSKNEGGKDQTKSEKDPQNTPKISKDKAEERDVERPIH